jgi:hypothetical protein
MDDEYWKQFVVGHNPTPAKPERSKRGWRRQGPRKFNPSDYKYVPFIEAWFTVLEETEFVSAAMYRVAIAAWRAALVQDTLSPRLANKVRGPDYRWKEFLRLPRNAKRQAIIRLQDLGLLRAEWVDGGAPILHLNAKPRPARRDTPAPEPDPVTIRRVPGNYPGTPR